MKNEDPISRAIAATFLIICISICLPFLVKGLPQTIDIHFTFKAK